VSPHQATPIVASMNSDQRRCLRASSALPSRVRCSHTSGVTTVIAMARPCQTWAMPRSPRVPVAAKSGSARATAKTSTRLWTDHQATSRHVLQAARNTSSGVAPR
jgi:hypothetical protein